MAQASYLLSSSNSGGNDRPSYDFNGQRELDWDTIEIELYHLGVRAATVEMVGRAAVDRIHGEELGTVFDRLATDIAENISRLKTLLGLLAERRKQP